MTHMSVEEFRRSFEFVQTSGRVDTYRNRETGQLVYVGRVAPPPRAAVTPRQAVTHDRLLRWARRLVQNEIPLHDRQQLPRPGLLARARLTVARKLLARVVALNPTGSLPMFLMGMIHRRFHEDETAFEWFARASEANPYEPNALREACRCALELGRGDAAVRLARRATELNPADHRLRANLAIALLVANRADDAKVEIDRALSGAPSDPVSLNILAVVDHFRTCAETPPSTLGQLESFQRSRRGVGS
jgi:tetratricopeptide (TPR) repeat protein